MEIQMQAEQQKIVSVIGVSVTKVKVVLYLTVWNLNLEF